MRHGKTKTISSGWLGYHVLNRANARIPIFTKDEDFAAFERVLEEAVARTGTRLLSYCLMGNQWHLVVWPQEDDELSCFVGWLEHANSPQTDAELAAIRRSVNRGSPFGDETWATTAI
ncbi:MAG: transposase [Planctomycetaceae bacterium]